MRLRAYATTDEALVVVPAWLYNMLRSWTGLIAAMCAIATGVAALLLTSPNQMTRFLLHQPHSLVFMVTGFIGTVGVVALYALTNGYAKAAAMGGDIFLAPKLLVEAWWQEVRLLDPTIDKYVALGYLATRPTIVDYTTGGMLGVKHRGKKAMLAQAREILQPHAKAYVVA